MPQKREFLQLAKTYRPGRDRIGGWYLSEKLDGTRCLWDGGISRGLATEQVPWASITNPRTGELKEKIKPIATGLWSRYGNPIMAPDWFLDKLPNFPCDGELWAGRGNFQLCRSICAGDEPDPRFDKIHFAVFSSPPLERLFMTGLIKNTNMEVEINYQEILKWIRFVKAKFNACPMGHNLEGELFAIREWPDWNDQVYMLKQIVLPSDHDEAEYALKEHMDRFLEIGGEGAILRAPSAEWTPKRVSACLKYKPWNDDEGVIVGFTSGRQTNKGSKHLGKIGALILDYKGKRLELSGLTDQEREFASGAQSDYAKLHPGEDMPENCSGKYFKIGQKVTFKYRELSDDGIPKEARYWRLRGEE